MATPDSLVRRLTFESPHAIRIDPSLEWLVTNGLGGYASGPIFGGLTRRFHGVLIASLPAPFGRVMALNHLRVTLIAGQREIAIDRERLRDLDADGTALLTEFRLESGLPVWRYEADGVVIEKRVVMPHLQNTTHVRFDLIESPGEMRLRLQPLFHVRPHEGVVSTPAPSIDNITRRDDGVEFALGEGLPPLCVLLPPRTDVTLDQPQRFPIELMEEEARGYDCTGDTWSPGWFDVDLSTDRSATLVISTEGWETARALSWEAVQAAETQRRARLIERAVPEARVGMGAELTLAADQFVILPAARREEAIAARAAGDHARTVIAGYHWFTDWGRDTMISLEGLTVATGRVNEAGYILRTFGHYVRNGLIPNMFPEGQNQGLYHTADATLWFFQAIDRHLRASNDRSTLKLLLPTLVEIADRHLAGTDFGIGVDAQDGLLTQGADGYQLTWMDAKVDGWVVTPRRGKAVEINALWYGALRLLSSWLEEEGDATRAREFSDHAARAKESFNQRFWNPATNQLFDVVDGEHGDDGACRPNQLFAMSLPHAVLDPARWPAVLDAVTQHLLTPVGLRSLSPDHPDFASQYHGNLRTRDAAYHQGTVWGWLIGAYVDAWLKVHPDDRQGARKLLEGFGPHLNRACIGTISEIFDAEHPFMPRGCVAQAWSVAEVLRAWVKTA